MIVCFTVHSPKKRNPPGPLAMQRPDTMTGRLPEASTLYPQHATMSSMPLTTTFKLRLAEEELDSWKAAATAEGTPLATFVRNAVNQACTHKPHARPAVPPESVPTATPVPSANRITESGDSVTDHRCDRCIRVNSPGCPRCPGATP